MLEGQLWKWTNYWNGWQSRWFILNCGILSYYKSYDEVSEGCKGSINISACDISVHPYDNQRLEISIPGQQYIYLRANSEKERQQWVIALGSAKASLNREGSATGLSNPDYRGSMSSPTPSSLSSDSNNVHGATHGPTHGPSSPMTMTELKCKKSELRLYCDLLMQQAYTIKTSLNCNNNDDGINEKELDEGTQLLSQTCDTFILTLDQLMDLTLKDEANESFMLLQQSSVRVTEVAKPNNFKKSFNNRARLGSESSMGGCNNSEIPSPVSTTTNGFQSLFGANSKSTANPTELILKKVDASTNTESNLEKYNNQWIVKSSFNYPFTEIDMNNPDKISTTKFIQSSKAAIIIFDYMGSNAFLPIKIDIEGHIKCLTTKYNCDPKCYETLDSIVMSEIKEGIVSSRSSGCHALLWLTRSLMFIHNFLRRFIESNDSVGECLSIAYDSTLKFHHDWVVRNVFSVAIQNYPSRGHFLESLGLPSTSIVKSPEKRKRIFQSQLFPILAKYLDSMEKCLMVLTQFYSKYIPSLPDKSD